jgi:hypothetical protein
MNWESHCNSRLSRNVNVVLFSCRHSSESTMHSRTQTPIRAGFSPPRGYRWRIMWRHGMYGYGVRETSIQVTRSVLSKIELIVHFEDVPRSATSIVLQLKLRNEEHGQSVRLVQHLISCSSTVDVISHCDCGVFFNYSEPKRQANYPQYPVGGTTNFIVICSAWTILFLVGSSGRTILLVPPEEPSCWFDTLRLVFGLWGSYCLRSRSKNNQLYDHFVGSSGRTILLACWFLQRNPSGDTT